MRDARRLLLVARPSQLVLALVLVPLSWCWYWYVTGTWCVWHVVATTTTSTSTSASASSAVGCKLPVLGAHGLRSGELGVSHLSHFPLGLVPKKNERRYVVNKNGTENRVPPPRFGIRPLKSGSLVCLHLGGLLSI